MRCVYCHDICTEGVLCRCGAVYHLDCSEEQAFCGTLGCRVDIREPTGLIVQWNDFWKRFNGSSAEWFTIRWNDFWRGFNDAQSSARDPL